VVTGDSARLGGGPEVRFAEVGTYLGTPFRAAGDCVIGLPDGEGVHGYDTYATPPRSSVGTRPWRGPRSDSLARAN
jgi:hypothetical protein